MNSIVTSLSAGLTASNLANAVPQIGPALLAIILFSVGFVFFRRFLRGSTKVKAKL